MRTEGETGSGFAMPVALFGKPLKPFPIFLRTSALTFVFDVAVQFAPGDAQCAAQQFVDYVHWNHAHTSHLNQSDNNSRQYRESSCNIRNSRKIHRSNLLERVV